MWVKKEFDFDFLRDTWSGAKQRMEDLTDELRDSLENILSDTEAIFGEEVPSDTAVNDFLWFGDDTYAEWLGFNSADQLWEYCKLIKKGIDEDDIYVNLYDDTFITKDLLEDEFRIYQSENPNWEEHYSDWEDFAEANNDYVKFERN